MGLYLILNSPSFFPFIWTIIKGFLDEKTRNKIKVVPNSETMIELRKWIDEENIPSFLGGRCICSNDPSNGIVDGCLLSKKGPWLDYDRVYPFGIRKKKREDIVFERRFANYDEKLDTEISLIINKVKILKKWKG